MGRLEDLLEELTLHTRYNTHFLRKVEQSLQQKEAEKTTDEWRPVYAVVFDSGPTQILSRSGERGSFSVVNNGPANALLSNRHFSPSEFSTALTGNANGLVLPIMYLPDGATVSIQTKGPLWAYSLGYPTSGQYAALQIIESLYSGIPGTPAGDGVAGKELHGLGPNSEWVEGVEKALR